MPRLLFLFDFYLRQVGIHRVHLVAYSDAAYCSRLNDFIEEFSLSVIHVVIKLSYKQLVRLKLSCCIVKFV